MNDYKFGAESVISSYMLKNCLFHTIFQFAEDFKNGKMATNVKGIKSIARIWVIRIYEALQQFCEIGRLPMFFLNRQDIYIFGAIFATRKEEDEIMSGIQEQNRRRLVFISIIEKLLGFHKTDGNTCALSTV